MLTEEQQKLLGYLDELPFRNLDAAKRLLEEDAGLRGGVLPLVADLVDLVRALVEPRHRLPTMKGEPNA